MERNYIEEQRYLKAKKRVKDIKGFYVHFTVFLLTMPIIISVLLSKRVCLKFIPKSNMFSRYRIEMKVEIGLDRK